MRPAVKATLVSALAALVLFAAIYSRRSGAPPSNRSATARKLAPDFTLRALDGQMLTLSSYRGKVVLLDFWATWCVPCREETPHFVEMQQKYGDRGLQIIGVSMDDTSDPVHSFYQQFHMNYPVVMGTPDTGSAYGGVLGLPIAFLLDREGHIFSKHVGATDPAVFEREIQALLQIR